MGAAGNATTREGEQKRQTASLQTMISVLLSKFWDETCSLFYLLAALVHLYSPHFLKVTVKHYLNAVEPHKKKHNHAEIKTTTLKSSLTHRRIFQLNPAQEAGAHKVNQLYLGKKIDGYTIYLYISNPTSQVISSNNDKIPYSAPDLPSDADSRGCAWLSVERLT